MKRKPRNVCVVSLPQPEGAVAESTVINLSEVLLSVSDNLYVLTKNVNKEKLPRGVHLINLKIALHLRQTIHPDWLSVLWQVIKIFAAQFETGYRIFKMRHKVDTIIFWLGADYLPLSIIITRLLGLKIVVWSISRASQNIKYGGIGLPRGLEIILYTMLNVLENMNFNIANQIVVESESVIKFANLERYKDKVKFGGAKYIDTDTYNLSTNVEEKKQLVGYLGRFVKQKGIKNLLDAIPIILNEDEDIEFIIGGYGVMSDEISQRIKEWDIKDKVSLIGKFTSNEAPDYFNKLKLFILPSYSEGLPVIVLEAMSCGSVVLATSVGGIPDIIKDEETGFILENNSPECIAESVIKVLNYKNLATIITNARSFVEQNYSYNSTVKRYENILYGCEKQ